MNMMKIISGSITTEVNVVPESWRSGVTSFMTSLKHTVMINMSESGLSVNQICSVLLVNNQTFIS